MAIKRIIENVCTGNNTYDILHKETEAGIVKFGNSNVEVELNNIIDNFQPKTDGTLATENKTVAGAINEVRHSIPNINLLDNSNFTRPVNQRGVSGTITAAGYFIDRWKLVSGSVTITAKGLQLNGTMAQILEFAAGADTDARVGMYSGTANATYNNNDKTFTLTSNGGVIEWAKLEKSNVATPYVPKGYSAELSECMRYYIALNTPNASREYVGMGYVEANNDVRGIVVLPSIMRIAVPSVLGNMVFGGISHLYPSNLRITGNVLSFSATCENPITPYIGKTMPCGAINLRISCDL